MVLKNALLLLISLLQLGCYVQYKSIEMIKKTYSGKEFRTDGYYFTSGISKDTSKMNSVIL